METAFRVCRECENPISVEDLTLRLGSPDLSEEQMHHHIVWLLKYGFLKLCS